MHSFIPTSSPIFAFNFWFTWSTWISLFEGEWMKRCSNQWRREWFFFYYCVGSDGLNCWLAGWQCKLRFEHLHYTLFLWFVSMLLLPPLLLKVCNTFSLINGIILQNRSQSRFDCQLNWLAKQKMIKSTKQNARTSWEDEEDEGKLTAIFDVANHLLLHLILIRWCNLHQANKAVNHLDNLWIKGLVCVVGSAGYSHGTHTRWATR